MISETKRAVLEWFTKGRNLYKLMKFGEAKDCFANPPPDDWDGVFVMTTK
jgi:hypothetical protein